MWVWAFGLILIGLNSWGALPPSDIIQFWRESGVNKAFVATQISNTKCRSSKEYLESCRQAVNEIKKYVDDPNFAWTPDFDLLLTRIDQLKNNKYPKEFVFGRLLNGHLRAFDAHAFVLPNAAIEAMLGPESRSRFGMGIHFLPSQAGLFVSSIVHGSPAEIAGLHVGDQVVMVRGKPVLEGMKAQDSLANMQGKLGDVIDMTVEHAGERKALKIPIAVIEEENISGGLLNMGEDKVAYVRLRQFRDQTCQNLKTKIAELTAKPMRGLILDLRDNMGGRLDEGVCISGLFMGPRRVVGEKMVPAKIPMYVGSLPPPRLAMDWQMSQREAEFAGMPVVVLINPLSASAAEIVAGALQDGERAWIVGERSYGKGTVQVVKPLPSDGRFTVGFTTAVFYRPSGATNELVGVSPNFTIPYRLGAESKEREVMREGDVNANALKVVQDVQPWKETRAKEVSTIKSCADKSLVHIIDEDFQKSYALAVLQCASETAAQHNSLAEQE